MSVREFANLKESGIRAVIHEAEEGGYWATVPAFPGCVSEGETIEETEANIREAAEVWLCTKLQAALQIRRPRSVSWESSAEARHVARDIPSGGCSKTSIVGIRAMVSQETVKMDATACVGRGLSRRRFIVGAAALAGSPWLPVFAATKPNLRLGLLSDVHVAGPRGPSPDAYRKALERFRDAHVDGVCITGDLAIWGQIKELEFGAQIWFDVFPDDKLPDGSPVARLFCTGNHDDDGWSYQGAYKGYAKPCLEEARKTSYFFHRQETWKRLYREDWEPIFFKEVKGYKFVLSNWMCRVERAPIAEGKVKNEKKTVVDWFAAHGAELPSDRPFFFLQHDPPRGTCNAPDSRGSDSADAFEALKPFPNCIALSGHTHYSTVDAKSIWQGEFTAINCGSTSGWAFTGKGRENGHSAQDGTEEMSFLPDVKSCRQGLLMDVYDDRITVSRFEVLSGRPSGPDWVIPIGASAARPYRFETRAVASRPPAFPSNAAVSVRRLADGQDRKKDRHAQIEVRFPAVNGLTTNGDRAYDYCVDLTVCDAAGERVVASRRVFSPMCLRPADEDIGDVICLFAARDVSDAGEVRFVVTPVNEWGKRGEPIRSTSFEKERGK